MTRIHHETPPALFGEKADPSWQHGIPPIRVHLNSGEIIVFDDVVDIELEDHDITLWRENDQMTVFDRKRVFFVGSGYCLTPM